MWRDLRPGDLLVSQDPVGLSDPEAWLGRVYLVLRAEPTGEGCIDLHVLGPDGSVPPVWSGEADEDYYGDALVRRVRR